MGEMARMDHGGGAPRVDRVSPEAVDDLLRRAAAHPQGSVLLASGALDAVAATFGVHAFVVDAARDAMTRGVEIETTTPVARLSAR